MKSLAGFLLLPNFVKMTWLIIIIVFIGLLIWILFSPVIILIDTRVPSVKLKWSGIGSVRIWCDEEWLLTFRIFFVQKVINLQRLKKTPEKKRNKNKKRKRNIPAHRLIRLIKTFRIKKWKLALDTGDYVSDARLFPLNYAPYLWGNIHINFNEENYLFLEITNRPWKIFYAMIR